VVSIKTIEPTRNKFFNEKGVLVQETSFRTSQDLDRLADHLFASLSYRSPRTCRRLEKTGIKLQTNLFVCKKIKKLLFWCERMDSFAPKFNKFKKNKEKWITNKEKWNVFGRNKVHSASEKQKTTKLYLFLFD